MTRKPRLTDLDLVLLSGAARRTDGMVLPPPATVRARGKTLEKALAKLLRLELIEECAAPSPEQAWRRDDDDRGVGLRLAALGRAALGLEDGKIGEGGDESFAETKGEDESADEGAAAPNEDLDPAESALILGVKPGTKQARLVNCLARPWGVSIADLARLLGWQPHTVRAAITGLRKKGYVVTSTRNEAGETVYRATPPAEANDHAA